MSHRRMFAIAAGISAIGTAGVVLLHSTADGLSAFVLANFFLVAQFSHYHGRITEKESKP